MDNGRERRARGAVTRPGELPSTRELHSFWSCDTNSIWGEQAVGPGAGLPRDCFGPRGTERALARNPFEYGPLALFDLSWTPAFAGVTEVEFVPVFQWLRGAQPPRRGTEPVPGAKPGPGPRREPTSASGPASHIYQAREIASAQCETDWGLAMTALGFSPQSRSAKPALGARSP